MKGIRTLVLQDLQHVLPPKGLQNRLASSYQLSSSSQLHTSPPSGRFWNFFEFSSKEEACRDAEKCTSSKDIVSPLLSANQLDSVRKPLSVNAAVAPSALSLIPKTYGFDLKNASISCLKIPRPLRQDNLMSMLDGNPVPRTLKWKLKGYKTLRNEQAGDFAFVPGGKSYDFDILSRTEYGEFLNEANCVSKSLVKQQKIAPPKLENTAKKDTLCLTAKAIENKEKAGYVNKLELGKLDVAKDEISKMESSNLPAVLDTPESTTGVPKLIASSLPKKEDIQFLPVSKAEFPVAPIKNQTQPSAQYSSQPKRPSSPSSPAMLTDNRSPANSRQEPPMESYEDKRVSEHAEQQASSEPSSRYENYPEVTEEVSPKWSTVEESVANQQLTEQRLHSHQLPPKAPQTKMDAGQVKSERRFARKGLNIASQPMQGELETSTYFAPRPFKRTKPLNQKDLSRPDYESIIGIPRQSLQLNISRPVQSRPTKSSPCAATHARLLQGTRNSDPQGYSGHSLGSTGNGSMAGSSGGGSRKPPAAYPPITSKRSSSNSSHLQDSPFTRRNEIASRTNLNTNKNSASNLSTSSANQSRRCSEGDDRCSRNTCGRRKCERERPKCKDDRPRKDKKICKRYCCPALQTPTCCDYNKFQCPKDPPIRKIPKVKPDHTCLPQEKRAKKRDQDHGGQEICTTPTRRRDRDRSCKRERRECSRDRSCDRRQQQQPCQRQRRPCKRQERECPRQQQQQEEQQGGREFCTNPRRRRDCKRERRCDDQCNRRDQKCSGRRNYTQSAYKERPKQTHTNLKRFSSLPAFAVPLIGIRATAEKKPSLVSSPSKVRFYVKETPSVMSCKDKKSDTKCKKDDPCAKAGGYCDGRAEGSCKERASKTKCAPPKKQDPCKGRKADPCKAATKCTHTPRKEDPCKAASKGGLLSCGKIRTEKHNTVCQPMCCEGWKKEKERACCKIKLQESQCGKKKDDKCKDTKKASCARDNDEESEKARAERMERERKEIEDCKTRATEYEEDKKEKKSTVTCKQQKKKGKDNTTGPCARFSTISSSDMSPLMNAWPKAFMKHDSSKLPNVPLDRSYSTVKTTNSDEFGAELGTENNFWSFNDNDSGYEELPVPVVIENDDVPDNDSSGSSNWFFSWYDQN
ncbi:uncharacterized protein LOC113464576 [Ceratina calcarata]|uniref:Uncharacterized protein LOC113464576 n=1 Tax=Ceratina calcarata TaxID=156304 RepID=A0AAJ7WC51_9HYME|nr:uncharacterized protein LOC113464576 [Ceratina calcarata]